MLAYDAYDAGESVADRKAEERTAFSIVDAKLKAVTGAARSAGVQTAAVDAAYHVRILWAGLIADLGRAENSLDPALRGLLISIGLRMLDCAERLREGDLEAAVEIESVGAIVAEGLAA